MIAASSRVGLPAGVSDEVGKEASVCLISHDRTAQILLWLPGGGDRTAGACPSAVQFIEQRLGVFQIGGIEALSEPAVDFGEHCTCFVAVILLREQAGKARRGAELPRFGALLARNLNRSLKASLSFSGVGIVLLQQQLAFEPMRLSLIVTVFMFICGGQRLRQGTQPIVEAARFHAGLGQQTKRTLIRVHTLALSRDGSTLVVGGDFLHLGTAPASDPGKNHAGLLAVDATTGQLTPWQPVNTIPMTNEPPPDMQVSPTPQQQITNNLVVGGRGRWSYAITTSSSGQGTLLEGNRIHAGRADSDASFAIRFASTLDINANLINTDSNLMGTCSGASPCSAGTIVLI